MKWWSQLTSMNNQTDFLAALAIVLIVWIALACVKRYGGRAFERLARRSETRWDDLIAETLQATSLLLLLPTAIYAGTAVLDVPARLERFVELTTVVALLVQAGLWAHRFVGSWMAQKIRISREREPEGATALGLLGFGARVVVWALVLLLALDQLNFDITALVAGLGIGGIAVALAVQNVLGDLFASLSIVLDKPFVVGDFIVVDDLRGTIEQVGIKTTRVRSLDGELLVFSNSDLLKTRIRNFKRMRERRVAFTVGVTYQTSAEKLRKIPEWLRGAVEAQDRTRFDRAHFKDYGDSALIFEIVYFVLNPDYNVFMDIHQAVNLAIYERFAQEGVAFAYPTRTLLVTQAAAQHVAG